MQELLERLLQSPALQALASNAARSILLCLGFGVCMCILERAFGAQTRQYRAKTFAHDVVYWIVNGSGIFRIVGGVALLTLIHRSVPQAQLRPLEGLPEWIQYVILLLAFDFSSYWVHRWQHASPLLWAFHSTHHTQEELSFATTARSHPVEQWFLSLAVFLPVALLLGPQPSVWLPVALAQQFLFAMTHSRLDWGFGPLQRVLVSPSFHSTHHSLRPEHHDRNFAAIFSFWDFLFGTATPTNRRVEACGLKQIGMPTFWSTLTVPFQMAFATARTRRLH
jgi:sterol desaturase/sphingolipid hydroxylase (fatty acid hydroxylase superfamily)